MPPFKPIAPWTTPQKRNNIIDLEAPLSTAAAIKLAALHSPRHVPRLAAPCSQHQLTELTQHATHESKTK
jgi:hypothetical protein